MPNQRYTNQSNKETSKQSSVENLSRAIFTVNRHAKTAPDPKFLYTLKRKALEKLIAEGKAQKKGLHFSRNPKNSRQQSDVLVLAGDYYFHLPPSKEDFTELPHLGELDDHYRNPKTSMSLSTAKNMLQNYTNFHPSENQGRPTKKTYEKPVFKRLGESY
ncbi:YkyB family protein [Sutcliffiella deserti]|uniref:YkyB family protein n=1 Tax=Sutcliffiella deserti TaxID=2875501 RepID=UPI001CBC29C9|nr:YkyB family protein [Sutcliffiella deserti]